MGKPRGGAGAGCAVSAVEKGRRKLGAGCVARAKAILSRFAWAAVAFWAVASCIAASALPHRRRSRSPPSVRRTPGNPLAYREAHLPTSLA